MVGLLAPAAAAGVPRACCFPLETLPADLWPLADELLWKLLDSEAVYTVAGGLKPVSDGFWQARLPADQATTPEVERVRAALAAFRCGDDIAAGVYVFDAVYQGKRSASAFVAHRSSLNALLARRADVFAPLGLRPGADPQRVMEAADRAPRGGPVAGLRPVVRLPRVRGRVLRRRRREREGDGRDREAGLPHRSDPGGRRGPVRVRRTEGQPGAAGGRGPEGGRGPAVRHLLVAEAAVPRGRQARPGVPCPRLARRRYRSVFGGAAARHVPGLPTGVPVPLHTPVWASDDRPPVSRPRWHGTPVR